MYADNALNIHAQCQCEQCQFANAALVAATAAATWTATTMITMSVMIT